MAGNHLTNLNEAQRRAVEHVAGPLMIVAGPGSGKTRVITHRIAHLVDHCGVSPWRIAAVTFTNKAAREMRNRLSTLLDGQAEGLTASTFHSFCARMLRRDGHHLGLDSEFVIYDDDDQIALLKRAMNETDVDPKSWNVRSIQTAISGAKSQLIDSRGYSESRDSYFEEIVHRVFERYEAMLVKAMAVDFDDLLLRAYHLLNGVPAVARSYQERYLHFMVDEFQDTNVAQYEVARHMVARHRNLCVVGDPDQSIYSWRHADMRNILSFKRDFPDAAEIALEQNYRSTKAILGAAQRVINPNPRLIDMKLWTDNAEGLPIILAEGFDAEDEAEKVIREVKALASSEGHRLGDMAVMYRVNAQSRALEEACVRYSVPYQLIGGLRFYHRQEVKDVVAYLRLLANPGDDVSLARIINVPQRGIGQRTMDQLTRMSRESGSTLWDQIRQIAPAEPRGKGNGPSIAPRSAKALASFGDMMSSLAEEASGLDLVAKIDLVLQRTRYRQYVETLERGEERLQNLDELKSTAGSFLQLEGEETEDGISPLSVFLESVSLVSDTDNLNDRDDAITLITLHQAKGLEFPVVFMVGMEEGLLPHSRSMDSEEQLQEERRLCYVGVTRAQSRLYLMRAFRRGFWGDSTPNLPSRFLSDIPARLTMSEDAARRARSGRGRGTKQSSGKVSGTGPVGAKAVKQSTPSPSRRRRRTRSSEGSGGLRAHRIGTGDRVRHGSFGDGVVVSVESLSSDAQVTVAFGEGHGVKRLLLSHAALEKIDQR